jgi:hypothetical protein
MTSTVSRKSCSQPHPRQTPSQLSWNSERHSARVHTADTLPETTCVQQPRHVTKPVHNAARRICHVASCPAVAFFLLSRATQALPRFGRRAACGASYHHALLPVQPITRTRCFSWHFLGSTLIEQIVHSTCDMRNGTLVVAL